MKAEDNLMTFIKWRFSREFLGRVRGSGVNAGDSGANGGLSSVNEDVLVLAR